MVERGIRKGSAQASPPGSQARIVIPAVGILDIRRRDVQAAHADDLRDLCQAHPQIAGAAPDIEHPHRPVVPAKSDEQGRETPAPAAHLELVAIAIRGYECRWMSWRSRASRVRPLRRCLAGRYCGFNPIALTSAALMAISFSTSASNSVGVMTIGSTPSAASLSLTLGSCSAFSVSR